MTNITLTILCPKNKSILDHPSTHLPNPKTLNSHTKIHLKSNPATPPLLQLPPRLPNVTASDLAASLLCLIDISARLTASPGTVPARPLAPAKGRGRTMPGRKPHPRPCNYSLLLRRISLSRDAGSARACVPVRAAFLTSARRSCNFDTSRGPQPVFLKDEAGGRFPRRHMADRRERPRYRARLSPRETRGGSASGTGFPRDSGSARSARRGIDCLRI